jgi:hypothetical protein
MIQSSTKTQKSHVTAPPTNFFELVEAKHREKARQFYGKYISAGGLPIVAAAVVDDQALERAQDMVVHMLAGRPDVLAAMVANGMYLIIIGKDQVYTDMPENSDMPNPDYWNERVRGTGDLPTSFGEENLLSLPLDRYDDESIAVHEFCHTIDFTMQGMDPQWKKKRNKAFRHALKKGLWKNTYAGSNADELWAECVQSYFDCNRVNNWNHGPIGTREQLKFYDRETYELIRTALNLSPEQDWRYQWLQALPMVSAPPERFAIDPFYTKFTWAREFVVLGRGASDEALLKANDIVRKMFAYRHDVLKALMAQGCRLVVLGADETIADLPEYRRLERPQDVDALVRVLPFNDAMSLLVVGEENLLNNPNQARAGDSQLVRVLADAIYQVTSSRPLVPNFDKRSDDVQQYELRVTRLDERFGQEVASSYKSALKAGLWNNSAAINGPAAYWTQGVLAYFDAAGHDGAPSGASHPINTREALFKYDRNLYELVNKTMAYEHKVDWRFRP